MHFRYKTVPVYLAFLSMGMIDAVGPMVSLARDSFAISVTMATLLPLLGYIMYGLLSVPTGLLQDRKGKKFVLTLGLAVALTGLLLPVLSGMNGKVVIDKTSLGQFYTILAGILLLGSGGAIIQVSGNPFIRDISEAGHYSRNLSFAQSIITVGSSMGFLLPPFMLYAFNLDWSILFPVYAGIVLTTIILLQSSGLKNLDKVTEHHASIISCLKLLTKPYVLAMVLGVFIYCGLEISMSAHVPILLQDKYLISVERIGLLLSWSLFYLPILSGRFFGFLVLKYISPKILLLITGLVAFSGMILIFTNHLGIVLAGILLVGLGFANIFPLLFSITIESMPEHTNELSGLMVSSIAGGAVLPPLTGIVADNVNITVAFLVPLFFLMYLLVLGIVNIRRK